MATALYPFNNLQIGMEANGVKGGAVPATRRIQCDGELIEEVQQYRSSYPAGYRANVGGAGVITRQGTLVNVTSELTAEEILWALETGVKGQVTPTGVSDHTWLFSPVLTTAVPTIDTATLEGIRSDGVTNHYFSQSAYGMTSGFTIDWALGQPAKLTWKLFARARKAGTGPTAGLVPYSSREVLITELLSVYWDSAWANLGNTQLVTVVRSMKLDVTTGCEPDPTADGRADLDFPQHRVGELTAKLQAVLEFNAAGASRFAEYRANSLVFPRLKNTGSLVSALPRTFMFDSCMRFTVAPKFTQDKALVLCTFELESVLDPTALKTMEFTAINGLTVVA